MTRASLVRACDTVEMSPKSPSRLLALLLCALAPAAAAAATYDFSGPLGGAGFPACSGSSWSASGASYSCDSGSITLGAGDAVRPVAGITIYAGNSITLGGNNSLGSTGAPVNLQTGWGQIQADTTSTIVGNVASGSGAVNLTGTTVSGSVSTSGAVSLSGGSVSGSVTGGNGVTTSNGSRIAGNVTANSGSISLSGGSVGGAVHSDCCTVTTTNTDIGNGVTSNSNTVTITGGTISGAISTAGGGGVVVQNATITSAGSITVLAMNVPISVSGSTVYGSVTGNNTVKLESGTTVWGNVTAGNWPEALQIDGTSQVAGSCSPANARCGVIQLDHLRLSHTGGGVTCIGSPVVVTACNSADSNGSCTPSMKGITGNLIARNGATIVATVPFAISAGTGSTTVLVAVNTPQTVSFETSGVSLAAAKPSTCWNSSSGTASCEHAYVNAGFIVSDTPTGGAVAIAAQTAGVGSATYYLRAVKTNPLTKACEAALLGANAVNFGYECVNPATCYGSDLLSVNGGSATTVARNDAGSSASSTPVTMTFDGNGSAPFTLGYADAGLVSLHAGKSVGATTLTGAASFVVKPFGFKLTARCSGDGTVNEASQTSPGTGDKRFCRAGDAFTATVNAIALGDGDPVTPNYGRETVPETIAVAWSRQLPAGSAFSDGTLPAGSFSHETGFTGSFTAADLAWSEVGILRADVSVGSANYLGAGNVASAAYVGRFYPHHFATTATGQCSSSFAYSGRPASAASGAAVAGQPFSLTVAARNAAEITTRNYAASAGFSRDVSLSLASGSADGQLYRDAVPGGANALPASKFSQGIASIASGDASNRISFVFNAYPAAAADIRVHAEDADNAGGGGTDGMLNVRSGRLRIANAFGTEKRPLDMPLQAQYWDGVAWVVNDRDNCTAIPAGAVFLSGPLATGTSAGSAPFVLTGGLGRVTLTAPNRAGSVDVAINLGSSGSDRSCLAAHGGSNAALPWLRSQNNSCATSHDRDPSARATFGIYTPENRRMIHVREIF